MLPDFFVSYNNNLNTNANRYLEFIRWNLYLYLKVIESDFLLVSKDLLKLIYKFKVI